MGFKTITGTVQAINIKADQAKTGNYGETCPMGVQIDGNWYNTNFMPKDKFDGFVFKCGQDGNFAKVEVGDNVTIFVDDSQYQNLQPKKTMINSKGEMKSLEDTPTKTAPAPFKTATPAPKATGVDWEAKDKQIRVGGLTHDAVAIVTTLIQNDACPKTALKAGAKKVEAKGFDDSFVLGLVEHYIYQLYMMQDKCINNIKDPEFMEMLKMPEEEK